MTSVHSKTVQNLSVCGPIKQPEIGSSNPHKYGGEKKSISTSGVTLVMDSITIHILYLSENYIQ